MSEFENTSSKKGFTCKIRRGERMNLIGFDVAQPEPDLVGFSIEVKNPDAQDFTPLRNRIAFSYPTGAASEVTGDRAFGSLQAPLPGSPDRCHRLPELPPSRPSAAGRPRKPR